MSEQKPTKDLRARLGKAGGAAKDGAPSASVTPSVGASIPAPLGGGAMGGGPLGGAGGLQPPFGAPAARGSVAPDPFGAVQQVQQKVVRIEYDDKPVEDAEIGRKRSRSYWVIGAVMTFVGFLLGLAVVGVGNRNKQTNLAIADGKEIYKKVQSSSNVMEALSADIRTVATAAGQFKVDYATIEKMQKVELPFRAQDFAQRNYLAFPEATGDLFQYALSVSNIFDRVNVLAAQTLPAKRREELDRAAKSRAESADGMYGVALVRGGEAGILGGLVFLTPGENKFSGRSTKTSAPIELARFTGRETIGEAPTVVIPLDNQASAGFLGQMSSAYTDYVRQVFELNELVKKTMEVQGRLVQSMGKVSSLKESSLAF